MPRKIQSSAEPTQQKKTSLKRALKPKGAGHEKKSGAKTRTMKANHPNHG